jgi:hypothetical protein
MGVTCNRECIDNSFGFVVQVNVTPIKDSLSVGDTLWINSLSSTTMRDIDSSNKILFDHSPNMGYTLRTVKLLGAGATTGAINDFSFVIAEGGPILGDAFIDEEKSFKFSEDSETYKLRFGMVCKTKGIYCLNISNGVNIYSPRHGSCGRATILFRLENVNQHLEYLQELYYLGNQVTHGDIESSCCFKVY